MTPLFRLALDLTAAILLVAGLAYWAMGNLAHELLGAGLFLLVLTHNGINRRWYGRLSRTARHLRGRMTILLNLALLVAMLALLATSLIVSRDLFGFLPFQAGVISRDIHLLAAHWVIVLVGLHIGMNWPIVAGLLRPRIGAQLPAGVAQVLGWLAALALAAFGLHSVITMNLAAKLINLPSMDMWDFTSRTPRFLVNWLSIVGLFAVLARLGAKVSHRFARAAFASPTGTPSLDKHTT